MTITPSPGAPTELTRPSRLGARSVLLPGVVLVAAVLMTVVAVTALDGLYHRDAGVIRAEQLLPYGLALRLSDLGTSEPDGGAARTAAERRWLEVASPLAAQAAVVTWRERDGRVLLVLAARTHDPTRLVAGLPRRARPVERVRAWAEGDRVAMAVVVQRAGRDDDVLTVLDQRSAAVRSSAQLQRSVALAAAALVPVVVLLVAIGVAVVTVVVVTAVVAILVLLPIRLVARRRRPASSSRPAGDAVPASGVRVVDLPRWRVDSTVSTWRVVPLAVVALPAATVSLWPESLVWAGLIALILVLAMRWAQGSKPALWLRRLLYVLVGLGLTHALVGWPPRTPVLDVRALAGLAALLVAVAVLAWRTERDTLRPIVVGTLGVRWLVMLVGLLLLAAASFAVFLGSNGEPDPRRQMWLKAVALPGLVAVPVSARRLRAARALAVRQRLRQEKRPEVLFLRSFVDDGLRVRSERRARSGLERWLPWPTELFEDVLVRGFEQVGPVVAIGKPGTDQTELGAARDLVVGSDWLAAVEAEMDRVRLITVVLGHGEGLAAELRALCDRGRLDRVCIVVPPVSAAEVAARLSASTRAIDTGRGWGQLDAHVLPGQREIVALVGWQGRRCVMVAKRRARASTYGSLAAMVSHEIATGGRS